MITIERVFTSLVLVLVLSWSVPSLATTTTIYFNVLTGNLGLTENYTFGTATIYAAAFNGGDLYGKNAGGDENGLGLTGDPSGDFEIFVKSSGPQPFIQLDLSDLLVKGYTGIQFAMNSSQSGDGWAVSACSNSGVNCLTFPTKDNDEKFYHPMPLLFGLTHPYLDFSATSNNVLIYSITATAPDPPNPPAPPQPPAVPEPGSLILLSTGLFGVAGLLRRWRR